MRSKYDEFIYRYSRTWVRLGEKPVYVYDDDFHRCYCDERDLDWEEDIEYPCVVVEEAFGDVLRVPISELDLSLPEPGYFLVNGELIYEVHFYPQRRWKRGFDPGVSITVPEGSMAPPRLSSHAKVAAVWERSPSKIVPSSHLYVYNHNVVFHGVSVGTVTGEMEVSLKTGLKYNTYRIVKEDLEYVGYNVIRD